MQSDGARAAAQLGLCWRREPLPPALKVPPPLGMPHLFLTAALDLGERCARGGRQRDRRRGRRRSRERPARPPPLLTALRAIGAPRGHLLVLTLSAARRGRPLRGDSPSGAVAAGGHLMGVAAVISQPLENVRERVVHRRIAATVGHLTYHLLIDTASRLLLDQLVKRRGTIGSSGGASDCMEDGAHIRRSRCALDALNTNAV